MWAFSFGGGGFSKKRAIQRGRVMGGHEAIFLSTRAEPSGLLLTDLGVVSPPSQKRPYTPGAHTKAHFRVMTYRTNINVSRNTNLCVPN